MSGTAITEAVFSSGQNEGIERSVLPLPQLSYVQNARQRKSGRWGKRFGTSFLPIIDTSGASLGSGTGDVRSVGPGFCVVDDQCVNWDQAQGAWPQQSALFPPNAGGNVINSHVPGAVSGWLPDKSFYPVPSRSYLKQTLTPCAQCFGLGYLWSAITYVDPNNAGDGQIRVVATNPKDQTVVYLQDFAASVAGQGGVVLPRLLFSGTNVILTYVSRPNNAARFVGGCVLSSLVGRFSAEISITTFIDAAVNLPYDACVFNANSFFVVSSDGTNTIQVNKVSNTSLAVTGTTNYVDSVGALVDSVSVITDGVVLYMTFSVHGGRVSISIWVANAITLAGIAVPNIDASVHTSGVPAYSALLPGVGVRCMYSSLTASTSPRIFTADVTAAGTVVSVRRVTQFRMIPITRPFTVGAQVYVWACDMGNTGVGVGQDYGFPALLRLPSVSEYLGGFAATYPELCSPIEMYPHDFLVARPLVNFGLDQRGLSSVTQIGTSATYSAMFPSFTGPADSSVTAPHDFRVIQARHYSDSAAKRSVLPVYADLVAFLPGGILTRVDGRGATEEGFALIPVFTSAIAAAGGALTASSTYEYVAVYRAISANGRFEVSGVSPVAVVVLGAGQTQVTLSVRVLDLGARQNVQVQIYRTLSNQSIFHLVGTIDANDPTSTGVVSFLDQIADSVIQTADILYTQIGQTLANGFPPPSQFGCTGGQRIWLGGLLRNDVIQCSKLIFGDQSPSFAAALDQFSIVLPAAVTGLAWMDNLVVFTAEGIYVVSGDGPDDSGQGSFSPPTRLPFTLGCIEPRSVVTVDDGTFFQTSRGLYLLPRGFGAPVPAGDMVMDTLAAFSIITGNVVTTKATEQTIRWSCVNALTPTAGAHIVYDLAHKSWSVDTFIDSAIPGSQPASHVCIGNWFGGECIMGEAQLSSLLPLKTSVSSFDDTGNAIKMVLRTGDMRPFGPITEGVLSKVTLLTEQRSDCTLNVSKTTDWGASTLASVAISGIAGTLNYTEANLGASELRDAIALRMEWSEVSAGEGLAFIAMALEHEAPQGLKRVSSTNRVT